jgi:hypothetical protein
MQVRPARLNVICLIGCLTAEALPLCAETVSVEHGDEIDLAPFQCTDLPQGRRLNRACYDAANRYLLVAIDGKYRQYCEIESGTLERLLGSHSIDHFFTSIIEGRFGCRPDNLPKYQASQPPDAASPPKDEVRLPARSDEPVVDD